MAPSPSAPTPCTIPIRYTLLVVFVVSSIAVGLTSFLPTYYVGLDGVEFATDQLRASLSGRTKDILQGYIDGVQAVNTNFHAKWSRGLFARSTAQDLLTYFCAEMESTPYVVVASLGFERTGEYILCDKYPAPGGGYHYDAWIRNASDWSGAYVYALHNETFAVGGLKEVIQGYDPRKRVWYTANAARQGWTTPFLWSNHKTVSITAGVPLRNPTDGSLEGVYTSDIIVTSMSQFLRQLDYGPNGNAFVISNATGEIFAVSWTSETILVNVSGGTVNDWNVVLRRAETLQHPDVRRVVGKLGGSSDSILALPPQDMELGKDWVSLLDVTDDYGMFFRVVMVLNADDFMGDFERQHIRVIIGVVCLIVGAIAVQALLSHGVLLSLSRLTLRMQELNAVALLETRGGGGGGGGVADVEPTPSSITEVAVMEHSFRQMSTTIQSFARYVPRDVVCDLLIKGELAEVGVHPAYCTVLFVDIENFTLISQRVYTSDLATMMQGYYDTQTGIIQQCGGVVDKYIGDAVMACWGAPIDIDHQNIRACAAAVGMKTAVSRPELQDAFRSSGVVLRVRIGISAGEVLAGNMGGHNRINFTLIGNPVNMASRLESLNKEFGTRIMISDSMFNEVCTVFVTRLLGHVLVAGFERPSNVYEVVGLDPDIAKIQSEWKMLQALTPSHDVLTSPLPPVPEDASPDILVVQASCAAFEASAGDPPSLPHAAWGPSPMGGVLASSVDGSRMSSISRASINAKLLSPTARRIHEKRKKDIQNVEHILRTSLECTKVCTRSESEYCKQYTLAVETYLGGDFEQCVRLLDLCDDLAGSVRNASAAEDRRYGVPEGAMESTGAVGVEEPFPPENATEQLRIECAAQLRAPSPSWTGTIVLRSK